MRQKYYRLIPLAVIAIIGIAYGVMALMMPLLGDDMGYAFSYLKNYSGPADLPLIIWRHWVHVNSRMADMLNRVWLCMMPRPVLAVMCGTMMAAYYALTIRCTRITNTLVRTLLIALLLLTMPWWDSFFLFVCQFNYVWSSVLVLAIIGFIAGRIHIAGPWGWLMPPMALLAGWMHEAAGLPAACGIIAWLMMSGQFRALSKPQRWSVITFCLGAVMSLTSPASWSRAAHVMPNDPMWLLLLKSDFYALALIVLTGYAVAFHRQRFIAAIRSPWMIFATAAIASMCISAIGGIVGRSGWFAQTFALIAMFDHDMPLAIRVEPSRRLGGILTTLLAVVMTVHIAEVVRWQLRADTQIVSALDQYRVSTDGTVYMNPIQRYDFPWWTLYKNKGVPDADDIYMNTTCDRWIGHNSKILRILPTDAQNLIGAEITESQPLGRGTVSPTMPQIDQSTQIVIPFMTADSITLYYTAPRIIDPGDR